MDKKKWPNLKLPSKNTEGDSQGVLTQEDSLATSLRIDLVMENTIFKEDVQRG